MALLFYVFFSATKHVHQFAIINPFAEDPYDAVGSFAVQIALFLALLSCLRSLLAGHPETNSRDQFDLVSRGNLLAFSAIALTLAADVVALARHTSSWSQSRNGLFLAAATFIFLTLSLYELARGWTVFRSLNPSSNPHHATAILLCIAASTVCLAVYPERWRTGIIGVLGTAILGMLLIFLQLGVISSTILRRANEPAHDLVDDVVALCESIKRQLPRLAPVYNAFDRIQRSPMPAWIAGWINPRRFRWRLCILSGAILGLLTIMMEFVTEQMPDARRALLLITIFVTIEAIGVTLAYALFGKPLSLFRDDRKAT
jgi:hypothetical protein